MRSAPRLCLVTIHGVGFEQPPIYNNPPYPNSPGYADELHAHLSVSLKNLLSDDPKRSEERGTRGPGSCGPIYVQSVWPSENPAGKPTMEAGRSRLGTWKPDQPFRVAPVTVTGNEAALYASADPGQPQIAHVALVYSKEEGINSLLGVGASALAMALGNHNHYGTILNILRSAYKDFTPQRTILNGLRDAYKGFTLQLQKPKNVAQTSGLSVRQDPGALNKNIQSSLHCFENDIAAYVCYNELRERIRGFILDALLRLACRDDVDGIIINSHSNGTVMAFDVLRQLPAFAARKVLAFVTAGSPLRKYTTLFHWGNQIEAFYPINNWWTNFFDPNDPIADQLTPSKDWHIHTPITPAIATGLYEAVDANTGAHTNIHIKDVQVDNLKNSVNSGIPAHDYWENKVEFIPLLARQLTDLLQV